MACKTGFYTLLVLISSVQTRKAYAVSLVSYKLHFV
jgi:hypothetical protein